MADEEPVELPADLVERASDLLADIIVRRLDARERTLADPAGNRLTFEPVKRRP